MALKPPTKDDIARVLAALDIPTSDAEMNIYQPMVAEALAGYAVLDALAEQDAQARGYDWQIPDPKENPHRAWRYRLDIGGAQGRRLSGLRVAVKCNIPIAGVPMPAGTGFLESLIPSMSAPVVERIIEEGGRICGTSSCEYLASSGGSHTGLPEPVVNPRKAGYSAGGSSSGSAALIAAGDVDIALGTDQGGSIRIPAAWCGVVGLKPTHGLVPYDGIMSVDAAIDHVGPLSRDVYTNALFLDALVGASRPADQAYIADIAAGVRGVKIGIVREGFGTPVSEAETDRIVLAAAELLRSLGAVVEDISIPMHDLGRAIWAPTFIESFVDTLFHRNGVPPHAGEDLDPRVAEALGTWRAHTRELPVPVKILMIAAQYVRMNHGATYYARSRCQSQALRRVYDAALSRHDILLMPTTPYAAKPLPAAHADATEAWRAALGMNGNTAPFCATGHPAISIPCVGRHALPIGMMLVGPMHGERILYRTAHAYETNSRP